MIKEVLFCEEGWKMKKIKIEEKFEINVKRFCLPVKIEVGCPNCKTVCEQDFEDQYFSYPFLNDTIEKVICCGECDSEFLVDVKLEMNLLIDEDSVKLVEY